MKIDKKFRENFGNDVADRVKAIAKSGKLTLSDIDTDEFVKMSTARVGGFPSGILPEGSGVYAYKNYGSPNDGGYCAGWILCLQSIQAGVVVKSRLSDNGVEGLRREIGELAAAEE